MQYCVVIAHELGLVEKYRLLWHRTSEYARQVCLQVIASASSRKHRGFKLMSSRSGVRRTLAGYYSLSLGMILYKVTDTKQTCFGKYSELLVKTVMRIYTKLIFSHESFISIRNTLANN
jgi:hypothetical protein